MISIQDLVQVVAKTNFNSIIALLDKSSLYGRSKPAQLLPSRGRHHEYVGERRDQALNSEAQDGIGTGNHLGQDQHGRGQSVL